ncbi:SCO7613 C-terminal domain-containing membrane protein [Streptomyces sp. NPDC086023]|uniref:SCO7613 C-terminal domain-containing membrane protein n=1 Tax=Streptomyces sp. NPDC086023 TaxID=3365746 RepID=UPI0037D7842E
MENVPPHMPPPQGPPGPGVPPPAEELVLLDRELVQLDARRAQLLARRAWLVSVLTAPAAPAAPFPGWQAPPAAGPARDMSGPSAQNVLLTLGAVLLTIAAFAFTVVSWGSMGIGGRAAVLGVVTAAALAAPVALLRRGLRSTAESVAGLGLALTVLDAYALYAVALPGTDGTAYTAGAAAVLAALWTAYGLALGALRLPVPVALVTAQLPLPLGAVAAGAPAQAVGWALLGTAVLDAAVALWWRDRFVRVLAAVAGAATGGWALLGALWLSLAAGDPAAAVAPGALLLGGAVLALAVAFRVPEQGAVPLAGLAGAAAVAALGGVPRAALPDGWAVLPYLVCAVPLLLFLRVAGVRAGVRRGLAGAGAGVAVLGALSALPAVLLALALPAEVWGGVWAGRVPVSSDVRVVGMQAAPVVLLVVAGMAGPWVRRRAEAGTAVVVLVWAALFTASAVLPSAHPVVLGCQVLLTAVAVGYALWAGGPVAGALGRSVAAGVCAVAGAASASVLSLAGKPGTFAVLGAFLALFAAAAFAGRGPVWARSAAAVLSVGYATGLLLALGRAFDLPAHSTALLVLAVPVMVALAAVAPAARPVRVPFEAAGAGAGALAVALALPDLPVLALVLALLGVVCAGTAVRADRRPAGYAAGALFLLAAWVRLAASGVTVPEAYTLPVTVPALVVGLLRRRRDPEAGSWTAYGPGLAATLVPSLVAAWGDAHWLRPLLLGVAALVVTLLGARYKLRAPLLLGGAVLALDALHELAPYVVQVADALPRWMPPALAGVLLLAVGATYERRLRDARRVREALGRMK